MSKFTASCSGRADYQLCLLDILYKSHFHWTALNKNQLIKMRKIIFKLRLDLIATNIFSLSLKKVLDWPGGRALNQKSIKLNPKLYFFKRRYICLICQKNMFNLMLVWSYFFLILILTFCTILTFIEESVGLTRRPRTQST